MGSRSGTGALGADANLDPVRDAADRLGDTVDHLRDAIHVWHVRPDEARDPALLARYRALLSEEEAQRGNRFHFERDQHRHLVTRALVRSSLSRYAPVAPRDWTFRENKYGRPEIAGPADPALHFNVSHTDGLIVCAVGLAPGLGVDVENVGRKGRTIELARRFFSPVEIAALERQPENARRARFFDYWTLKEAYIKARGMGLSIPLREFSLHIEEDHGIRISFGAGLNDAPERWQFAICRPSEHHVLAIAVERDGPELHIEHSTCLPLSDSE